MHPLRGSCLRPAVSRIGTFGRQTPDLKLHPQLPDPLEDSEARLLRAMRFRAWTPPGNHANSPWPSGPPLQRPPWRRPFHETQDPKRGSGSPAWLPGPVRRPGQTGPHDHVSRQPRNGGPVRLGRGYHRLPDNHPEETRNYRPSLRSPFPTWPGPSGRRFDARLRLRRRVGWKKRRSRTGQCTWQAKIAAPDFQADRRRGAVKNLALPAARQNLAPLPSDKAFFF